MKQTTEKKRSRSALAVVFMTVFLDLVGFGIIIPLSGLLPRDFGASAIHIGLLMTVYSLMQFVFSPLWGRLSDRFGRRPVMLVTIFGSIIGHLLFAFASQVWMFFLARCLSGLFAANISTAQAYIADITPQKDRSKGMGLIGAAFGLGFVLGPALGGLFSLIGENLGSAPPFGASFAAVAAASLSLLNFIFAYLSLPESLSADKRVKVEKRVSRFESLAEALKRPMLGPLMIAFFLTGLAMAHMESTLFLFVEDRFGWDLKKASFGFAYVGIVMAFTQGYLVRKLIPVMGERWLLLGGLSLSVLGFLGIAVSSNVWTLAIVMTVFGVGYGLANPSFLGLISIFSAQDKQGLTLGVNHSLAALGRIIGPALGGYFYSTLAPTAPFLMAGALSFCALLIVGLLISRSADSFQKAYLNTE